MHTRSMYLHFSLPFKIHWAYKNRKSTSNSIFVLHSIHSFWLCSPVWLCNQQAQLWSHLRPTLELENRRQSKRINSQVTVIRQSIASQMHLLEQCSFTGGNDSSFAMSEFFNLPASSMVFPLTHSVANELDAMAEPHPNVLNFASMILPFSSTLICNFITSPQAGAPTRPVPTLSSFLSNEPTLRGFS